MRLIVLAAVAAVSATPSTCEYLASRPPITAPSPAASPTTSPAALPTPDGNAQDPFSRYDRDRDGRLSQTEYVEGRWGDIRFIRAPTDEEVANHKRELAERFKRLDRDGDGFLSRSEFRLDE